MNNMFLLAFVLVGVGMIAPLFLPCRRAPQEAGLKPVREVRWASLSGENFSNIRDSGLWIWLFLRTAPARLTLYDDFCVIGYVGFIFQYLEYCVIPYSKIADVEHTWR